MTVNMDPLQKQKLDDVFDAFSMLVRGTIVSLMHVEGGFTRYSASAVDLFNLPGEYIPNGAMDWNDYLHPEDRKRYMDVMIPLLEGRAQTYDITYRVRTKTGEYGNFRAIGAVLRGDTGEPSLIGGALFNEGLSNNIDPVTVLPNKNAYLEQLTRLMHEGKSVFSLLVGINGLSEINQVHGYTYGNRVLQEVAWLIQETVKDRCAVYRTDGATFALLTDALSREQITAIYDMLRYRLQRGIEINGIRNILAANGGMIAVFSNEAEASTVYACLYYAYEESRQHKHGDLVDFNGSINYDQSHSLERINTIRDCVGDDCRGFFLEYVPVIDAATGRTNGAEATIAWKDEQSGRVGPEQFMPILERDFIFEELGDFILRQGLLDGAKFLEKDPGFLLCLNVYRIQLEADYFLESLHTFLRETGFPPPQLSLKFASDCRYIDANRMREIIDRLHEDQILVIIDGFGSGADSIGFLKSAPVDAVCLESKFLHGVEENARDRDILEYLTKLAASCVKHINVKGVDRASLRDILRDYPVTTMQGALFADPLSFEQMLARYD
ncbi:MAG: EAL domain-containing protein [Oscillospiraceae bacterium]|nr:EAL domain-containing protein [Oscillospiraceae bacterium]